MLKLRMPWCGLMLIVLCLLSSCKQPSGPEPTIEPDTVRSYVRAIITAPGTVNQLWEVRRPDTLSNGVVGVVYADGSRGTRTGDVAAAYIDCFHNTNPNNNVIAITIRHPTNVSIYRTVIGQQRDIDSLRTWEQKELQFLFIVPTTIEAPFTPTKLRAFVFTHSQVQEQYLPSSGNQWSIYTLFAPYYKVLYNLFFADSAEIIYKSEVKEAFLIIDYYDSVKHRISGRFHFRVIGSINKEVIDIRDGVFDNVKLRVFSD
jgi:hypothetical protein